MKKTLTIEAMHSLRLGELAQLEKQILDYQSSSDYLEKKVQYEEDEDERDSCCSYPIINGTAVIGINGPLLTRGSWISKIFGYASYDGIRADMQHAAANPDVIDILMFIGSPGGAAAGVSDGAEAIKKAGAVKNLYAYSSSMCCSGAMWLAAPAKKIFISPEAEIGSIGVVVSHFNYSKQLENEGIEVTRIRSSDLKAVGSPHFALTDKEVEHITNQVETIDTIFKSAMLAARPGISMKALNGATFIGESAVTVGLADAVLSYDDVMQYIQTQRSTTTQTHGGFSMNKQALRAALDSGKSLDEIGCTQEEVDKILSEEEAQPEATEPVVADEGIAPEIVDGDTTVGIEAQLLVDLNTQISTLTADATAKDAKIAQLEAQVASFEASATTLKQIVAEVTTNRRIALNFQSSVDLTKFSTESLLAEYEAVTDAYDKEFKTGGLFKKRQASVEEPKGEQSPLVQDSIHEGQLRAANITR